MIAMGRHSTSNRRGAAPGLAWARGPAMAVALVAWASSPAAAQSVWEFTPYRLQVFLALGAAPELSPRLTGDLAVDVEDRTRAILGAVWDTTITPAPALLRRALIADLSAVTADALPKKSLEADKVILIAVLPGPSGYQVTARELDVRTMTFNALVRVAVGQPEKLRDGVYRAVRRAFAPLARIDAVDKKHVTLRLRAAALPPRDPAVAFVRPGDVFQPLFRYNDREGKPRRITTAPFTFLTVQQVAQPLLRCALHSGVRSPLGGRRRGRIEQLALAVIPPRRPTTLALRSRADSTQVLAGYDLYVSSQGAAPAKWLGRTDWKGQILVEPAAHPLRILLVKSGGELLARLPIVPGMYDELVAPLPDNKQKLRAEGYIKSFQEELIDLITRREVLLAQTRALVKANRLEEANKAIVQLRTMTSADELIRALDQEAKKVVTPDPLMQHKIDALFADTRKLVEQHLDPSAVEKLADAVRDSRAAKPASKKK